MNNLDHNYLTTVISKACEIMTKFGVTDKNIQKNYILGTYFLCQIDSIGNYYLTLNGNSNQKNQQIVELYQMLIDTKLFKVLDYVDDNKSFGKSLRIVL